jgi:hypothetical protein
MVILDSSSQNRILVAPAFHHRFETMEDTGRSLSFTTPADSIVRVRVTGTVTPGVTLAVDAHGTGDFFPVTNGVWTSLGFYAGLQLRWGTTHAIAAYHVNPAVSDLLVEWLTRPAMIESVRDIANDQGGWVRLDFTRSAQDFANQSPYPITNYCVWRRVAEGAAPAAVAPVAREGTGAMPLVSRGGRTVLAAEATAAASFPPGTWELVANVSALQRDNYLVAVPTEADSTAQAANPVALVVTAHTTTPWVWYVSQPDSGWSTDDLAPGVPENFVVAYGAGNALDWDPPADDDLQYFRVYRGADPSFVPGPATLAHVTATNAWTDAAGGGGFYKVTAVDHAGNESAPAAFVPAVGVEPTSLPTAVALGPGQPNPFADDTWIRYAIPGEAFVDLAVYDASGRHVRRLVWGVEPAGERTARWDGREDGGARARAGIYFVRLRAGAAQATRKVVLRASR